MAAFRCVPLDHRWTGDTKLDMKAIYRRPARDAQGQPKRDAEGRIQWDLTSGMPLRRHSHWLAKGFEYVTLADAESLSMAASALRDAGLDPAGFVVNRRNNSPWDVAQYLAAVETLEGEETRDLAALVAKHGADATEEIMRVHQPGFVLPAKYRSTVAINDDGPHADLDRQVFRKPGRPKKSADPVTV